MDPLSSEFPGDDLGGGGVCECLCVRVALAVPQLTSRVPLHQSESFVYHLACLPQIQSVVPLGPGQDGPSQQATSMSERYAHVLQVSVEPLP